MSMGIIFMNRIKSNGSTYLIAGMLLLVVGAAVFLIVSQLRPTTTLYLSDGVFDARFALTPAARERGLGGVTSLGSRDAMILVFPSDDKWKIWMKDMQVPIDIVWLNQDRRVVYSVTNVSPDNSDTFTPDVPARYVVELPAGTVASRNIKAGRAAVFEIPQGGIE
jgi:uncharacterized membrane protein (UPF0127 family)